MTTQKNKAEEIQNFLFSQTLKNEKIEENLFRFLIVEEKENYFLINFSITEASWERANLNFYEPEFYIQDIIEQSDFKDVKFHLIQNSTFDWRHDWTKTSKSSHNNFPTLVLIENEDKSVHGVFGRITHNKNTAVCIADADCEKNDVEDLILHFQQMKKDTHIPELGFVKETDVSFSNIEEACKNTPDSPGGQKEIIIYKNNEWFHGLWNNPNSPRDYKTEAISLSSVADFYGTKLSKAKKQARKKQNGTLKDVIKNQTIPGDVLVLYEACKLALKEEAFPSSETNPSVKLLCDWWNKNAPEGMKNAGAFRAYLWDKENLFFQPYDGDEPICEIQHILRTPTYSIFQFKGKTLILTFTAKKEHFTNSEHGVNILYADLSEQFDIWIDMDEVMETYYSVSALQRIYNLL